jgi:hypothetical protein
MKKSSKQAKSRTAATRRKATPTGANLNHAFERLTRAQRPMATGPGSLQGRLDRAFLEAQGLSADELPLELQEAYQSICDRLVVASTNPLTDPEAESVANRFFDLYVKVIQQRLGIV